VMHRQSGDHDHALTPFQRVAPRRTEKPDRYWSAPLGAERPVNLVVEIGYVRGSEIRGLF
jgi:hypothetical protein